jgi:hypothetical protein
MRRDVVSRRAPPVMPLSTRSRWASAVVYGRLPIGKAFRRASRVALHRTCLRRISAHSRFGVGCSAATDERSGQPARTHPSRYCDGSCRRPSSFGREHGRRVSRRASPAQPGLGRFAQSEVVAPPGDATVRPRRWAVATFARALERAKLTASSPGCGSSTPEWGPFRTLNWTLNAESHPQRERTAAGRRAQNPAISRQNRKMARPGIEPGTPRFSGMLRSPS